LLSKQSFGNSTLAIELWGHTLLANSYKSGEMSKHYQCKIYPISLNENLNIKSTSIKFKLVITLVIGLFLGHQIDPLLESFVNKYNTAELQSISLTSDIKIKKLEPNSAVAQPTLDDVGDNSSHPEILNQSKVLTLSDNAVFEENGQSVPLALTTSPDETNNKETDNVQLVEHIFEPESPHWYFELLPSKWLSEYNINLDHQLQTKNNQYYIQYGVYRHKISIIKFTKQNPLLSDYYYLCYSSDWQKVALMTGVYQGYRQAFNRLIKIKEQGGDGTIVNSSYLNTWQCSNVMR